MGRLNNSLASAGDATGRIRIVAMHYPPVNEKNQESEITRWIGEHRFDHMLYGHLHGPESFRKLARAMYLFYTTTLPIKTVAARVGYRSPDAFVRAFRARYRLDPGDIGNDPGASLRV